MMQKDVMPNRSLSSPLLANRTLSGVRVMPGAPVYVAPSGGDHILTEAGDYLTTESGDRLIIE